MAPCIPWLSVGWEKKGSEGGLAYQKGHQVTVIMGMHGQTVVCLYISSRERRESVTLAVEREGEVNSVRFLILLQLL